MQRTIGPVVEGGWPGLLADVWPFLVALILFLGILLWLIVLLIKRVGRK